MRLTTDKDTSRGSRRSREPRRLQALLRFCRECCAWPRFALVDRAPIQAQAPRAPQAFVLESPLDPQAAARAAGHAQQLTRLSRFTSLEMREASRQTLDLTEHGHR